MADPDRVAVLIDCDNISHRLADQIFAEASLHGTVSIKRGYGDWSSNYLKGWRELLPRYAINPIQQPSYTVGKNSTDAALTIDAMDLLYADNVDVFCIVSSDSDFTRLAMRLRESARRVHGIGARSTAESFVKACDRFTYTEVLAGQLLKSVDESEATSITTASAPVGSAADSSGVVGVRTEVAEGEVSRGSVKASTLPDIEELLVPAIKAKAREDGWAMLSTVGWYVVNNDPSFDSRNYGFAKLGQLIRTLPFVEVTDVPDPNGFSHPWVRLKSDHHRG